VFDFLKRKPENVKTYSLIICLAILIAAGGCASSPAAVGPARTALTPRGPLYAGDGGRNTKIAVLQPQGENLARDEQWLSSYIQGTLNGYFSRYTAMTVIDRQNLDKIIDNQNFSASGYFSDNDFISIGNISNAEYILIGSLQKIPQDGSFMLDLSVSHAGTGQRMASFAPSLCTFGDIQRASIIQKAFEDISGQLGITLTEYGKQSLHGISNTEIAAETSLSKGITAQKNNRIGEALSYYYNAASFSPTMPEVKGRLSGLSSSVSSGDIVESINNDFKQREAWFNILKECEVFYTNHLPYEIIYNPNLRQRSADYGKRTVDLEFILATQPTTAFKVIQDILDGLKKSGKKEIWGFPCWPFSSPVFADYYKNSIGNDKIYLYEYNHEQYLRNPDGYMTVYFDFFKYITVEVELIDNNGNVLSTTAKRIGNSCNFVGERGWSYDLYQIETMPSVAMMTFKNVNIDDLKENIYVKITSVNGIEAETAAESGYVNISSTQNEITYPQKYYIYK
jgi:hypothetical protein